MKDLNSSEVRKFKMHPDLLFSVIKSQAGTQEKALLEAVMNAVDAGATHCNITIDNNGYKVSDDGRGFQSRQEVDEFFETFGTPHKEGDAVYGRFRMGRGQLFAFSSTIWKTTNFTMTVDIKKNGLDYVLEENKDFAPGCTIVGQWYEYMADQSVYLMTKELEKLIKYMQIPVLVNGKDMTVKVDEQKWDYKEDDFYVKVNRGGTTLSVYNMGALVSHYPASRFGVAGVVVTKSALKVNFARNDVLISECSLWKKISKKMFEVMGIETSKKNILTDSERDAIINSLLTRSIYASSVLNKGLILDVSGKKINLKNLLKISKLCFSSGEKRHKKIEERINDSKMSIVLSDSNFSKFGVTEGNGFIEKIKELVKENNEHYNNLIKNNKDNYHLYQNLIYETFNPQIEDVFKLGQNISDKSTLIDNKKLTKKESIFLKVVESINLDIARITYNTIDGEGYKEYWNNVKKFQRRIYLGNSDLADAWTDGSSFIAINKSLVNADPMKIVHLLVHEYCHNESTLESHDHGMDFYEAYHNVMKVYASDISNSIYKIQKSYNKLMLKEGLAPKKSFDINIKNTEDYYSVAEQEKENIDKIVVNLD